jgi:hypothetical protein
MIGRETNELECSIFACHAHASKKNFNFSKIPSRQIFSAAKCNPASQRIASLTCRDHSILETNSSPVKTILRKIIWRMPEKTDGLATKPVCGNADAGATLGIRPATDGVHPKKSG